MKPMTSTSPRDLVAIEQHAFVAASLEGAARVLEVGAGRGELARRLAADGHDVTALDLALPEQAPAAGVRWVERDFFAFDDAPFDAIAFTASLHHLSPLVGTLDHALSLLRPGGVLVVDDFDLDAPDDTTASWFYETQELLAAGMLYDRTRIQGTTAEPALGRWRAEHEHEHGEPLHPGSAMLAEITRRFETPTVTRGPYLYRYVCAGLASVDLARHVFEVEERRIARGSLRAVGLRVVARKR
jgi:SAM-dependent methyltransferase